LVVIEYLWKDFWGGQFAPELGGQFTPELGGQFTPLFPFIRLFLFYTVIIYIALL
jgi:hypothetical protein